MEEAYRDQPFYILVYKIAVCWMNTLLSTPQLIKLK
jgi:hypothetical protein